MHYKFLTDQNLLKVIMSQIPLIPLNINIWTINAHRYPGKSFKVVGAVHTGNTKKLDIKQRK